MSGIEERLLASAKGGITSLATTAPRRIVGRVDAASVVPTLEALRDAGCDHLSALTALDDGKDRIDIVYHLSAPGGWVVSLKAALPRGAPRIASVCAVLPAAALYEREAHEMFGVEFEGHPGLSRLLLHEGWPVDEHPLRKDWKHQEPAP